MSGGIRPVLAPALAILGLFFSALHLGCSRFDPPSPSESAAYRVAYDPYRGVNWETDHRCLTQFHDHVVSASRFERFLLHYDQAGYHAVSPLHYSGDPSHPEAWRQRYWPISDSIPSVASDEALLERFENLRILIPGAEEVGFHHVLSPFLSEYIEKWEGKKPSEKYPWHYESLQDCIDRIRSGGGLAVLAHPWEAWRHYDRLEGFQAIEIFSGYANHKFLTGERGDDNSRFLELWDRLLAEKSTRIWGIGVNDWFGPGRVDLRETHPTHFDTGKTVILIRDWTLAGLREAFERGAMFAIKDVGEKKGGSPRIDHIESAPEQIEIHSDAEVRWISNRKILAVGRSLSLKALPGGLRYVRAEAVNATGTVFVQPFTLEGFAP